jgi:hypothetical protein
MCAGQREMVALGTGAGAMSNASTLDWTSGTSNLIIYIEKKIAMEFTTEELIDDFDVIQTHRAKFK